MTILKLMEKNNFGLTREKIHEYESLLNTDYINDNVKVKVIDAVTANRYINDFYGLLHNELNIPDEAFYLHLRINGYKSSLDYDANKMIKILNPEVFETIKDTVDLYFNM